MLNTEKQVQEYAKIFSDLIGGAENLVQFTGSLPAPDENGNVRNVSAKQLDALREAHKAFAEVWEAIGEFEEF